MSIMKLTLKDTVIRFLKYSWKQLVGEFILAAENIEENEKPSNIFEFSGLILFITFYGLISVLIFTVYGGSTRYAKKIGLVELSTSSVQVDLLP